MHAMILAAGKGTRLAPLTRRTPKPMLPLGGKPLIELQVATLARAGATRIVINLHHLGEQIRQHLGDGDRFGVEICYSEEPELLETGGGIAKALPLLGQDPFWLMNGDIWSDFNFSDLPTAPHAPHLAHLVLTPTPPERDRGDFEYHEGQVTARGTTFVYCGIAVLCAELFEGFDVSHFSLRDRYFDLIASGRLGAQVHNGRWHDIGTVAQYQTLATQLA